MTKEEPEFTFESDFSIIPMRQGSYMVEQGVGFSQAFSSLNQVVDFLIYQKTLYLGQPMSGGGGGSYDGGYAAAHPSDYEHFDHTGLKKEDE